MYNTYLADVEKWLRLYKRSRDWVTLKRYYMAMKKLSNYGSPSIFKVTVQGSELYLNVPTIQDARDIMKVQYGGYEVLTIQEIKCKLLITKTL